MHHNNSTKALLIKAALNTINMALKYVQEKAAEQELLQL
jgi:hypothetical protein